MMKESKPSSREATPFPAALLHLRVVEGVLVLDHGPQRVGEELDFRNVQFAGIEGGRYGKGSHDLESVLAVREGT